MIDQKLKIKNQRFGNGGVYVVGTGVTKFGELWAESLESLANQAAKEALEEARLKIGEIDLVVVGNMLVTQLEKRGHVGRLVAEAIGFGGEAMAVEAACASGGVAVRTGVMAIRAGMARRVLVVGVEKMTDQDSPTITRALMAAGSEAEQLAGATFPALYAMMHRAYQKKYKLSDEAMAEIAVMAHWHGARNPLAQFQKEITKDTVLKSELVADPMRLFHCAPISDGAAAVVLSTEARSTKHEARKGVQIVGSGAGGDRLGLAERKSLTSIEATKQARHDLKSQITKVEEVIQKAQVLEIHDCFSVGGYMALEDLGLCGRGRAPDYVREAVKFTINPSGGLKACGHPVGATGVKQLVEITRQLQGRAGKRQVKGARVGLAHNVGGTGGTAIVHILVSSE